MATKALAHKDAVMPPVSVSGDEGDEPLPGEQREEGVWYREPGTYAQSLAFIWEAWERIAAEYEANPGGFYESYHYLNEHPAFWHFTRGGGGGLPPDHVARLSHSDGLRACMDFDVVKADPETGGISEDASRNTAARVWFEFGKHDWPPEDHTWHDWRLDDGAATYEGAVILAARKVWENYGNDRRIVDSPDWNGGDWEPEAYHEIPPDRI